MNEHILNDSELDTHELASCSAGFIKVYDDPNFRGGRTAGDPCSIASAVIEVPGHFLSLGHGYYPWARVRVLPRWGRNNRVC